MLENLEDGDESQTYINDYNQSLNAFKSNTYSDHRTFILLITTVKKLSDILDVKENSRDWMNHNCDKIEEGIKYFSEKSSSIESYIIELEEDGEDIDENEKNKECKELFFETQELIKKLLKDIKTIKESSNIINTPSPPHSPLPEPSPSTVFAEMKKIEEEKRCSPCCCPS